MVTPCDGWSRAASVCLPCGLAYIRSTRAERDCREGRFYSTVLVLIAVMDGFVNDVEPSVRRGMHARVPSELDAWNSVVGHHKGLTNVLPVFQRPFKALDESEVF
jgi:hypothetical protein